MADRADVEVPKTPSLKGVVLLSVMWFTSLVGALVLMAPSLALLSDIAVASEHEHETTDGQAHGPPHLPTNQSAAQPFLPGELVLWCDASGPYGGCRPQSPSLVHSFHRESPH